MCLLNFLACCCGNFKPKCYEITILILNVIFVGLIIWAIAGISTTLMKLVLISSSAKTFYIIGLVCTIISLIMNIILMILRCVDIINTSGNIAGRILCIVLLCLVLVAVVLVTIGEIKVGIKMGKFPDELFSDKDWVNVFLPPSVFQSLVLLHSIYAYFLLRAIWAKTNKSYKQYKEDKLAENIADRIKDNQNNKDLSTTIHNAVINQNDPRQNQATSYLGGTLNPENTNLNLIPTQKNI